MRQVYSCSRRAVKSFDHEWVQTISLSLKAEPCRCLGYMYVHPDLPDSVRVTRGSFNYPPPPQPPSTHTSHLPAIVSNVPVSTSGNFLVIS